MSDVERFSQMIGELSRELVAQPADAGVRRALAIAANGLGAALHAKGEKASALAAFERAIKVDPGYGEAIVNAGNLLSELERHEEAHALLAPFAVRNPKSAAAQSALGIALRGLALRGRAGTQEAATAFEAAVAIDPSFADAYCNLGVTLGELGLFGRALAAFDCALELDPENAHYYRAWSAVRRVTPEDAPRVAAMERVAQRELPAQARIELCFALGKAYEDLGRHEEAFAQWVAGNTVKRASIAYDEPARLQRLERIAASFSLERMEALQRAGDPSRAPVFIIGMPRSGTTLIEQILASHSQVHALGERMDLAAEIETFAVRSGVAYPEFIAGVASSDLRVLGEEYLASVGAGASPRVTDKMPENFVYAGAIALALPNARIIHVRRDPIDTCVSCFAQLFTYGNAFTLDLTELGHYYRAYERLMEHWRAVLPAGMMLEVRYEDVVADLETQARRIIAHAGLAWEGRVLEFHRARNAVRTASVSQVRRPIYSSSVGRYHRYGDAIAPLIAALQPG
jgi:tetratricopeptide (TPR) repeat protein